LIFNEEEEALRVLDIKKIGLGFIF